MKINREVFAKIIATIFIMFVASTVFAVDRNINGIVDQVTGDGVIRGWICAKTHPGSINYHIYVGGSAGSPGATGIANKIANRSSEPAVAAACNSTGSKYRFLHKMPLSQRIAYAGKKVYVHGISPFGLPNYYIKKNGVIPSIPAYELKGWVDNADANGVVSGWACAKGSTASVNYEVWVGGPRGSGVRVASGRADRSSNSSVANQCQSNGSRFRYSAQISSSDRIKHAGKKVYVHAVAPYGDKHAMLSRSNVYTVKAPPKPPLPSVFAPLNNRIVTASPTFELGDLAPGVNGNLAMSADKRGGSNNQFRNTFYVQPISGRKTSWDGTWDTRRRNGYDGQASLISPNSPSQLTPGKTYYWHIVVSKDGVFNKSQQYQFTVEKPPVKPLPIKPGSIASSRPTFKISNPEVGVKYGVSISKVGRNGSKDQYLRFYTHGMTNGEVKWDTSWIDKQRTSYEAPSASPTNIPVPAELERGVKYFWHVTAMKPSVGGGYLITKSDQKEFIVETLPLIPEPEIPADNAVTSDKPEFKIKSTENNVRYSVSVSMEGRCGNTDQYIDFWNHGLVGNRITWSRNWKSKHRENCEAPFATEVPNNTPDSLTTGQKYYWHVVAIKTGVDGDYLVSKSVQREFTVEAGTVEAPVPLLPTENLVRSVTPCFKWQPSSSDYTYTVQLASLDNEANSSEHFNEFWEKTGLPGTEVCFDNTWEGKKVQSGSIIDNGLSTAALNINETYVWRIIAEPIQNPMQNPMQSSDQSLTSIEAQFLTKPNIVLIYADDLGWNDVDMLVGNVKSGNELLSRNSTNIAKMAQDGVVFSNAYSNGAVCSPSRASLMTGRYATEHDVVHVTGSKINHDKDQHNNYQDYYAHVVPFRNETLAARLKQNGYETILVGKWHLQERLNFDGECELLDPSLDPIDSNYACNASVPLNSGFDMNLGGNMVGMPKNFRPKLGGGFDGFVNLHSQFPELPVRQCVSFDTDNKCTQYLPSDSSLSNLLLSDFANASIGEDADDFDDLTETLTRYAKEYLTGCDSSSISEECELDLNHGIEIAKQKEKPFFLMLSHYGIHVQLEDSRVISSPEEDPRKILRVSPKCEKLGTTSNSKNSEDVRYACMVGQLDKSVEEIRTTLNSVPGLSGSTYVVFTSDNGPHRNIVDDYGNGNTLYSSSNKLRGTKGTHYEAGIKVPMVMTGPKIKYSSQTGEAGRNVTTPVMGSDLYETLLGFIGVDSGPISESTSSVDLSQELMAHNKQRLSLIEAIDRPLFWYNPALDRESNNKKYNYDGLSSKSIVVQQSFAGHQYKLVNYFYPFKLSDDDSGLGLPAYGLYNLSQDPQEKCNLMLSSTYSDSFCRHIFSSGEWITVYMQAAKKLAASMCDIASPTRRRTARVFETSEQVMNDHQFYSYIDPAILRDALTFPPISSTELNSSGATFWKPINPQYGIVRSSNPGFVGVLPKNQESLSYCN